MGMSTTGSFRRVRPSPPVIGSYHEWMFTQAPSLSYGKRPSFRTVLLKVPSIASGLPMVIRRQRYEVISARISTHLSVFGSTIRMIAVFDQPALGEAMDHRPSEESSEPDGDAEDFLRDSWQKAFGAESAKVGRFNLAIFGKTGVGKSTLINAVFGEDVAETGIGGPITKDRHLFLHKSGTLGILDAPGLEIGVDSKSILSELAKFLKKIRKEPLSEQPHVAWYCVRANDRRFEDVEAKFIQGLSDLGLPVILVFTQVSQNDAGLHPDSLALAQDVMSRNLPIFEGTVFHTMAAPDPFNNRDAHGLQHLLDATFRAAPEGVEAALRAAQVIDDESKAEDAWLAIKAAAAAAAAAGATPIPFSDTVLLVPTQIAMMARIAIIYGIELEQATAASLAASSAASNVGRSLVGNVMKMIPGIGSIGGGFINATVASGITTAMGAAWLEVCKRLAKGELKEVNEALNSEMIRKLFSEELRRYWKRKFG